MTNTATATKPQSFYDGYERMIGMINRHGWTKARDMFNEQYPVGYVPENFYAYHHAEGMMTALSETM